MIGWEKYRLVLYHEFVDAEGDKHNIDKPICVEMNIDYATHGIPTAVVVNRMIDQLSQFVLKEVSE